ncbi:hypothetical protein C2E23DRAFT_851416, partial [Lenzites betulinus]
MLTALLALAHLMFHKLLRAQMPVMHHGGPWALTQLFFRIWKELTKTYLEPTSHSLRCITSPSTPCLTSKRTIGGHNRRRRACQLWTTNLLCGRFSTWMPMGRKCRGAAMSRDSILTPWLTVFSVAASPIVRVCTEYGRVDEHLTEVHNGAW